MPGVLATRRGRLDVRRPRAGDGAVLRRARRVDRPAQARRRGPRASAVPAPRAAAGRRSRACTTRSRRGAWPSIAGSAGPARSRCSRHPIGPLQPVLEREGGLLPGAHPGARAPAGAAARPAGWAGPPAGTSGRRSRPRTGSSQISMLPVSAPRTAHCTPLTPRSRVTASRRSGHHRAQARESATATATASGGRATKVSSAMSSTGTRPGCRVLRGADSAATGK